MNLNFCIHKTIHSRVWWTVTGCAFCLHLANKHMEPFSVLPHFWTEGVKYNEESTKVWLGDLTFYEEEGGFNCHHEICSIVCVFSKRVCYYIGFPFPRAFPATQLYVFLVDLKLFSPDFLLFFWTCKSVQYSAFTVSISSKILIFFFQFCFKIYIR